jgi:hypothetical protein
MCDATYHRKVCSGIFLYIYVLQVDLAAIKVKFLERHGRELHEAVKDETSGDYRKALLKILDKA